MVHLQLKRDHVEHFKCQEMHAFRQVCRLLHRFVGLQITVCWSTSTFASGTPWFHWAPEPLVAPMYTVWVLVDNLIHIFDLDARHAFIGQT